MKARKYNYELMISLYKQGVPYPEIARQTSCRPQQISQILDEQKVKRNRGKGTGIKKLTPKDVKKIYKLRFHQLETNAMIAAKFNVGPTNISQVCLGHTWKELYAKTFGEQH